MPKRLKMPTAKSTVKIKGAKAHRADMTKRPAKPIKIDLEEPMGLINGRKPESSYEWNMARALWSYGWDFMFQVPVYYGRERRGGQVLDFLVRTAPLWTALPVDGGYWHRNKGGLKFMDSRLLQGLRQRGFRVKNEVIRATDKDAHDFESAKKFVWKNFGRGSNPSK